MERFNMLMFLVLSNILAQGHCKLNGFLYTLGGLDSDFVSGLSTSSVTPLGCKKDQECQMPGMPNDEGGFGFVFANVSGFPVICGGGTFSEPKSECYRLGDSGWKNMRKMSENRISAAFTMMDEDTLWVAGGHDGDFKGKNTSEIFSFAEGWTDFAELPQGSREGCLAKLDCNTFFYGGGFGPDKRPSAKNWVYSLIYRSWTQMEDMPKPLAGMGCIGVKDKDGTNQIVITGGRDNLEENFETFILSEKWGAYRWSTGPSLPDVDRIYSPLIPLYNNPYTFLTVVNKGRDIYKYGPGHTWSLHHQEAKDERFYFGGFFFKECPIKEQP